MQVAENAVVAIDYTLKSDDGSLIDSSQGGEPLSYIQGKGNLIPGVEDALNGKDSGQRVKVTIPPERGYGERDESLVLSIERDKLADVKGLEEGVRFRLDTQNGPVVFTVMRIDDAEVLIDGNHPLAGMNLHFDITIKSVREATAEELEHGHIHE